MEVFRYAQEKGVTEIVETMPKDLMVARLKARGIPAPSVPPRAIGAHMSPRSGDTTPDSHHYTAKPQPTETSELDAASVLEREWQQQQTAPVFDAGTASITEVRKELKRRGIKMARTDNMTTLKAKLDGKQDAA